MPGEQEEAGTRAEALRSGAKQLFLNQLVEREWVFIVNLSSSGPLQILRIYSACDERVSVIISKSFYHKKNWRRHKPK